MELEKYGIYLFEEWYTMGKTDENEGMVSGKPEDGAEQCASAMSEEHNGNTNNE